MANVNHDNPHFNEANQIFLSGGPLAILPLNGNRSSIVWSLPKKIGSQLAFADADSFVSSLKETTGNILGNCSLIKKQKAFPLYLRFLGSSVSERKVFIGDSAQGTSLLVIFYKEEL